MNVRLVALIIPLIVACRFNDTVSLFADRAAQFHHTTLGFARLQDLGAKFLPSRFSSTTLY